MAVPRCRSLLFVLDMHRICPLYISNGVLASKTVKLTRVRQCRPICTTRTCWYSTSSDSSPRPEPPPEPVKLRIHPELRTDEVSIEYYRGLPQITVPLPSRREKCRFTLRPVSHTVGHFLTMLCSEDRGIDHVAVTTTAGVRIASSNTIEALMEDHFLLTINDICYHVLTPTQERLTQEEVRRLSDVKNLVNQLYEALNVEEHQLKKERELHSQLEQLKEELEPMEQQREQLHQQVERHTNTLTWVGLGMMSVQFGILARLTWWEYSWDIMEPVTYFVTYGTAMAAYAYYVLTKQEYVLPEVRDRQYLLTMHKQARKIGLDLNKYNQLRDQVYDLERDLRRLRDPLQIHLPPHNLVDNLKKTSNPFARALSMFQQKRGKPPVNEEGSKSEPTT